jgi:hypothetical protein
MQSRKIHHLPRSHSSDKHGFALPAAWQLCGLYERNQSFDENPVT